MNNILLWIITGSAFIIIGLIVLVVMRILDKQKIKIYMALTDRKQIIIKRKPINNQFEYDGGLYDIDNKNYLMHKNRPIYYYHYNNPKPLDPYTRTAPKFNAREYHDAIKSKIIRDIVASNASPFDKIGKEIIFFAILAVMILAVAYLGNEKITALQEQINNLSKLLGGA